MLQPNPGGGVPRNSSDGDDRMVTEINTQKTPWTKNYPPPRQKKKTNPMPNFRALKFPEGIK